MDKNLMTRSGFARLAGVHLSAITRAIEKGKFSEAYKDGKIDINHQEAKDYLENNKGNKSNGSVSGPESSGRKGKLSKMKEDANSQDHEDIEGMEYIPEQIRKLSDWPLKKLVKKFGTVVSFMDWLKATKMIEDIETARLKNGKAAGELVTRDLIVRGVIDPIETAHIKMITDGVKNIANRIHSMAIAGKEVEDCEKYARETLQSFIRPMKAKVARTIKQEMEDFED